MTTEKKHKSNLSPEKKSILEFILVYGPVSEPDIREQLKRTEKSVDQGTVNRYLHDLQKIGCIGLIPPEKKGLRNHWDITEIEHLRNIKISYPDLSLKAYQKSIIIILRECREDKLNIRSLKIYMYLLLSTSLFEACIDLGINTLLSKTWQTYLSADGFENDWKIKKSVNNFYELYIRNRVSPQMSEVKFRKTIEKIASNIDIISEEAYLREVEVIFPHLSKEMSVETFLEVEEEVNKRLMEKSEWSRVYHEYFDEKFEERFPGWKNQREFPRKEIEEEIERIKSEFSDEIFREKTYQKICEEIFLKGSKKKEDFIEAFRDGMNKDRKMYKTLIEIWSLMKNQQKTFESSYFDLLLKHFCEHDILTSIASPEEIEFVMKIKENHEIHLDLLRARNFKDSMIMEVFGDLKPISKIIAKYKQPSIFYISDDSDEVYLNLKDFFCPNVESHIL